MRDVIAPLGSGSAGPVKLAVALAIVATPVVGLSLLLPPIFEVDEGFEPPSLGPALLVAGVASIAAAIVGGAVGGLFVRSRPTIGALLAFAIAWPVAIVLLPIVAAALGITFETAYSCFDTCGPMVHSGDALSGGGAYLVALATSLVTIVPVLILGLCLFGAYKLNQSGYPFVATLVLGLGYGAIHWLAVLGGGPPLIGFVALLLGVSTWTWVLREPLLRKWPGAPAGTSAP